MAAAVVTGACAEHFQAGTARCPRCRRALCLECPLCDGCGARMCAACAVYTTRWVCPACASAAERGAASGPSLAPRGRQPTRSGDDAFQAVDLLVAVGGGAVGLFVALFAVVVWASTSGPRAAAPGPAADAAPAGAGAGPADRQDLGELLARASAARRFAARGDASALLTPTLPTPAPGPTPVPTLLRDPQPVLGPRAESASGAPGAGAPAADPAAEAGGLRALVDGLAGPDSPAWRTADNRLPAELRFTAGEYLRGAPAPALAGRVLFAHAAAVPPETWARDVEVWAVATPAWEGMAPLGRWALAPNTEPQVFAFDRRPVWGVWLRVLSNHGSAEYTTLGEFALLPAEG